MKKITIGRGNDCKICVADTTDIVSRHHAVISFSFWGKMKIYDTSSNGTYINNERLQKGVVRTITRKDSVNLGHVWDLDWAQVEDPYRKMRLGIILSAVVSVLIIGLLLFFILTKKAAPSIPEPKRNTPSSQIDSTETVPEINTSKEVSTDGNPQSKIKKEKKIKSRDARKTQSHGYYADSIAVDDEVEVKNINNNSKKQKGKNVSPIIY